MKKYKISIGKSGSVYEFYSRNDTEAVHRAKDCIDNTLHREMKIHKQVKGKKITVWPKVF